MSTWRPASRFPKWLAWLPRWTHAPIRWGLRALFLAVIVGTAVTCFYLIKASEFDLDKVAELPDQTTLLDRDGNPIRTSWGSARDLASRDELPDFLVRCLEAREDARFYEHPGIDVRGLTRATLRNLQDWEFTQGASTLTMQLARNTYDLRAKSIHRKLLEIALTLRIEHRFTKDQILTHYLNRIYFGSGCHGIAEASRTYFGKPVAELHRGECAMLVGIIRGPHLFSPIRDMEGARDQQEQVLERMIEMGRITEAESREIAALPIELASEDQRDTERSYAVRAVRRELNGILAADDIRRDGLVVHTTLAPSWLLRLETEVSESILRAERSETWPHPTHAGHEAGDKPAYLQCAAVTIESTTGEVLAVVGGRDFLDSRYDRSTGARRDLGTLFEPWIAAAAAERGRRVLAGKPLLTGRQIGPRETARIARRCGLGGPFLDTEDLFRGSAAATPMETATGLATLASDGRRPSPHFITRIAGADGETIFERDPEISQAITGHAADKALEMFETVGVSRIFQGSTGSDRDAWMLRVGPTGSTAIWLGFDDPKRIAGDARLDTILDRIAEGLAR